jgi:hypothetical protein
MAPGNTSTGSI